MEIITKIENGTFDQYDGYKVHTSKRIIQIFIRNDSNCCEAWGYLSSDDNLNDYIGATLYSVDIVTEENKRIVDVYYDAGDAIFVDFMTSAGKLQLVVYNNHNGYYGHHVEVISIPNDEILETIMVSEYI